MVNLTSVIIPFIHWGTSCSFTRNLCSFTGHWPIFYLILSQTFNESYNYQTLLESCSEMSDFINKTARLQK